MLIQAKKLRWSSDARLEDVTWRTLGHRNRDKGFKQFEKLVASTDEASAAPYYLFYPEAPHAHYSTLDPSHTPDHPPRCAKKAHTTPEAAAAVIIHASKLFELLDKHKKLTGAAVVRAGRSLLCLTEHRRGKETDVSDYTSLMSFIRDDDPSYTAHDPSDPMPAASHSILRTNEKSKPVRRTKSSQTRRSPREHVSSGSVLLVFLGDWKVSTSPERERDGHGWYREITAEQLKESSRKYWKLAAPKVSERLLKKARGEYRRQRSYGQPCRRI